MYGKTGGDGGRTLPPCLPTPFPREENYASGRGSDLKETPKESRVLLLYLVELVKGLLELCVLQLGEEVHLLGGRLGRHRGWGSATVYQHSNGLVTLLLLPFLSFRVWAFLVSLSGPRGEERTLGAMALEEQEGHRRTRAIITADLSSLAGVHTITELRE